ncbi:MAG: class II fructose-bisphosphate aldolase [archaeon]
MFKAAKQILVSARKGHYALPSFNTCNLEVSRALLLAAEAMNSPLMIQITESTARYAGLENIFGIVQQLERRASVPVCVHLDHGKDLALIRKCISIGFKSVMVDASKYPFAKNVAVTKKIVAMAKRKGCSVEAELGALKKIGSKEERLTDPKEAMLFVEKSGCDSLAVAIGTSHGAYKFEGKARLDFARLKEISGLVSVPLVLHGASSVPKELVRKCNRFGAKISNAKGVPESDLKKAIGLGVAKINIDTDLRLAFTAGIREFHAKNPEDFDPRNALLHAQNISQRVAEEKIALFGAKNRA